MARRRYWTDLSDEEWAVLEPLLPTYWTGHHMKHDLREIVNAILYLLRSGCSWRLLPHDLPPWPTVQYHFRKWRNDGTWERVCQELRRMERVRQGRDPEPSAGSIDSQSVKTTESGGPCGYDAGKHVNGRKRHLLVDTLGLLLLVVVHAVDIQDRDGAKLVLAKLSPATKERLRRLWADGGYAGALIDWVREHLDAILEIVAKDPKQSGFRVLPRRWVVERTFAWFGRYRRLSKDYEQLTKSSEAMIYLAAIHTMLKRTPVSA